MSKYTCDLERHMIKREKYVTSRKNAKVISFPKRKEREIEHFENLGALKENLSLSKGI